MSLKVTISRKANFKQKNAENSKTLNVRNAKSYGKFSAGNFRLSSKQEIK